MAGAGVVRKVLGGIAKAPGAVAGFTGATIVGAAGGAVKATGKGIASGVKAAGKMKTKILGEAAEAAAKGGDDVVEAAAKKASKKTGQKAGNAASDTIDGQMKMNFDNGNFTGYAEDVAETVDPTFFDNVVEKWNGLPTWAQNTGIATAGVIAGGILLDDDDE